MCTKLFTKPAYMLVAFLYYNALNLSPKFSKCPVENDPGTACFLKESENFGLFFCVVLGTTVWLCTQWSTIALEG